ncbi:MAG: D-alanyl-D-alanine carboxypeptidase family protein [Desulfotomaculales bacterium]
MKKLLCLIICLACLTVSATPAFAGEVPITSGLETTAASAVLMEPYSGSILFAKEPHKRLPIASVTKIMTMLLAVEAVEQGKVRLDDTVVASETAAGMGGSQIFLAPQEEMTFYELLLSVATASANDASVAIAEHLAGSEQAFAHQMNKRAKALGLNNTNFVNCTGLTVKGHYSSAYDQAIILREALEHPLFKKISQVKEYDLRGGKFKLWNTNKLLWFYDGTDAGKTGWTEEAHYCLASSAVRDGLRLIAVVLGTPEPKSHFRESIKLYNWGFANFRAVSFIPRGTKMKDVAVEKGTAPRVKVVTAQHAAVVVPRGEDQGISFKIELPPKLTAPVGKGQVVGTYIATQKGQTLVKVALVAAAEIRKATPLEEFLKVARCMLK